MTGGEKSLQTYLEAGDEAALYLGTGAGFPHWWSCANSAKNRFTSSVLPKFGNHEFSDFARSPILRLASLVRETLRWLWRIWTIRRWWRDIDWELPSSEWVAVKTFGYESSIRDSRFCDPFFGRLAEELESSVSIPVLTLVDGIPGARAVGSKLRSLRSSRVLPIELFVGYGDVFRSLRRKFEAERALKGRLENWLMNSSNEVAKDYEQLVEREGWRSSLSDLMFYQVGEAIGESGSLKSVFLTHEANSWERMFIAGVKSQSTARIFGYQHSVVPPAAAGVFEQKHELSHAPIPDEVFTTGVHPRNIILRYGVRSKNEVHASCALRYEYLYANQEQEKLPSKRLLVALEGLSAAIDLVKYVLKSSPSLPDWEIVIRTHPVFPWEMMKANLGDMEVPSQVKFSSGGSLEGDLLSSSVVMYWGSTVALEAIMFGRPVIHFNRGDAISFDPLFELESLHWTVSERSNLPEVLESIEEMNQEARKTELRAAQSYVKNYLINPVAERMETFMERVRATLSVGNSSVTSN